MTDENKNISMQLWISKNAGVFVKLMTFTAAIIAFPIVTFFLTLHSLFEGNTTYAAIAAVIMVNLILALYIITAYFETPLDEEKRPKKE